MRLDLSYLCSWGIEKNLAEEMLTWADEELGRRLHIGLQDFAAIPIRKVPFPTMLEDGATGVGKTEAELRGIAKRLSINSDYRIATFTKTNALGDQVRHRLLDKGVEERATMSHYGRAYVRPKEGPVCHYAYEADLIQKAGGDPDQLCVRGRGERRSICNHALACPIYKTRYSEDVRSWFAPHAMLPHPLRDQRGFDHVLIDEDPIDTFFEDRKFSSDTLLIVPFAKIENKAERKEAQAVCEQLTSAFLRHVDGDGRVRNVDLPSSRSIADARRFIFSAKSTLNASPNPDCRTRKEIEGTAKANMAATNAARLLEGVLQCLSGIDVDSDIVHGLRVFRSNGEVHIQMCIVNPPHRLYCAPTVILSATARVELLRAIYPAIKTRDEAWPKPKHARYVRVPLSGARSSLLDDRALTNQGQKILTMIHVLAKAHKDVLVVAQKAVVDALERAGVPHNVELGNFGAVEGKDDWRRVGCVFVVGRPLPPPVEFWMKAERISGEVIPYPGDTWDKSKEALVIGTNCALRDYSHEHWAMDALLRVQVHAAVLQADRSRALQRSVNSRVEVIFLNTLSMDGIMFDEIRELDTYCDWRQQMRLKGICLDPAANRGKNAVIAAVLPEKFEDAKAVENHFRYAHTRPHEDPGFEATVRGRLKPKGARYAVPVFIDAKDATEAVKRVQLVTPGAEIEITSTLNPASA